MRIGGQRRKVVFFIVLGAVLVVVAVGLNAAWVVLNLREKVMLALGLLLFPIVVAGLVLNTIFLVREVRRNEQHNAFINAVTHELKTPVASIRLYLETLQQRVLEPARREEFYRIMLADTERLQGMIDQILRAGRAGYSHRWIRREALELDVLVRECIAQVAGRYGPERIVYRVTPEAHAGRVSGDADELRAAIANLLDNAMKYSALSGSPVQVDLAAEDETLVLGVRDQGVGIAPRELKAIFKRFYRAPSRGASVTGAGLGLFIVRSVVRRHGGKVRAESAGPGHGSRFVLQLPRLR